MRKAKQAGAFKFEQALERIETIVERMESGEMELDQALALYQEGMELMAKCQQSLNEIQKNIKKLTRDSQNRLKMEVVDLEEEHHG